MSWINVMIGAGIGATAGGGMSALNGGSTEDIIKGALVGGTVGAASSGLLAPAAPAAAPVVAPVVESAVAAPVVDSAGTTIMSGGIGSLTPEAGTVLTAPLAESAPIVATPLAPAAGQVITAPLPEAGVITAENTMAPAVVGPTATPSQIANASAYTDANMGTRLLADVFGQQGNIVGNTGLQMAGGALQGSVTGAGINGLMAAAQGQDVGEAMGKGAILGGVGGGAAGGIGSLAGSGGYAGQAGDLVAAHPIAAPAVLSAGAGLALDSSPSTPEAPKVPGIQSDYYWDPNVYKPYRPMAQGGITDIDLSNPDPDRGDSIQFMADGGVTEESYRLEGIGGKNLHREASQDLREFLESTPDSELSTAERRQKYVLSGKGMADGGVVGALMGQGMLGELPGSKIMESVYDTTLGNTISPKIKDFLFGTPDEELTPDQRRKKAQIIQQEKLGDAGVPNVAQDIQGKGMADGGISHLGGYSDGGRLLKGPGDGVSDDIPAIIGGKEPARLAEGEFVVPARIVSELGNGSTDAGAKRLYAMMDRIQSERKKTTGKGKFSDNPKAYKHLPA